jgi:hypothetical protein
MFGGRGFGAVLLRMLLKLNEFNHFDHSGGVVLTPFVALILCFHNHPPYNKVTLLLILYT